MATEQGKNMPVIDYDSESAQIDREIAAFEDMKAALEQHHLGKWAVVRGGELAGTFDTFDTAAREAHQRFGRGPYLIRQIGATPMRLPISAYRFMPSGRHADH